MADTGDRQRGGATGRRIRRMGIIGAAALGLMLSACDANSITGLDTDATGAADLVADGGQTLTATPRDQTNERDVPWEETEVNPCTNDVVTIRGTSHFVVTTGFDGSGGFHLSSRVVSKGTGLGAPSGFTYKVDEQEGFMDQTPVLTTTIRQEQRVLVKGPRSVDNYLRHLVFKMTVNGNGVPTVLFERSFVKCGGETIAGD